MNINTHLLNALVVAVAMLGNPITATDGTVRGLVKEGGAKSDHFAHHDMAMEEQGDPDMSNHFDYDMAMATATTTGGEPATPRFLQQVDPLVPICHRTRNGYYKKDFVKLSKWGRHRRHGDVSTVGDLVVEVKNPNFEIIYKEGTTTSVGPFNDMTGASGQSNFRIPSFGDTGVDGSFFDVPNWSWDMEMGVANLNSQYTSDEDKRDMVLTINGNSLEGGPLQKTATQNLKTDLEQRVTYTLTADFGQRNDNDRASKPPVLRLYAGNEKLQPIVSTRPLLEKGKFVTHTRTYFIDDDEIEGKLKIEVGIGKNVDGQQLNVDRVTLTKYYCKDMQDTGICCDVRGKNCFYQV